MRIRIVGVLIVSAAALAGCSKESATATTAANKPAVQSKQDTGLISAPAKAGAVPVACGEGGAALLDVVAVSGDRQLRAGPSDSAAKIKNEKASRILGKDVFHQVDGTTTVRRLCVQAQWTEIQIVTPDWLTHVRGWAPNAALREIESTTDGRRLFVEEDFYWDKDTSRFKPQIVAIVNKIHRENASCGTIETGSVAKSPTRSKPGKPVFFVNCGSGAGAFNVWFAPSDAQGTKTFDAVQPIARGQAVAACESAAKQAATHPSTVDFSHIMDLAYTTHASGRARVLSTFSAKNAFNLQLKYRINCLFEGNRLIETTIAES